MTLGGGWRGGRREVQEERAICIGIDSHCCIVETNNSIVKQLYPK